MTAMGCKIQTEGLNLYYGKFHALLNVNLSIQPHMITAIIGPSGCGKSTLLRCFNRMNDLVKGVHVTGHVRLDGVDILGNTTDLSFLRRRVGMVFQRPNPFPLSIFDNVTYGLRVHGETHRAHLLPVVESSLQATGLWDEVKDRLSTSALDLSPERVRPPERRAVDRRLKLDFGRDSCACTHTICRRQRRLESAGMPQLPDVYWMTSPRAACRASSSHVAVG
jgi:ABC-type phosphate transport system ATPase subunit